MTTHYLCFPDEATFLTVAAAIGAIFEGENGPTLLAYTSEWGINCIGPIVKVDSDGNVVQTIKGYHVNMRMVNGGPIPSEFEPYVVTPNSPVQDFI